MSAFEEADSLYSVGNYAWAALEYERIVFSGEQGDDVNKALFGRVQCFKQMESFDKASDELLRIKTYMLNPDQLLSYYYEKILCYYLQGKFSDALSSVDEMYLNIQDTEACNSTLFLQILIHNELRQWDKAKEISLKYAQLHSLPDSDGVEAKIKELYAKKSIPKLKNRKVSKVLSFVPGLGHVYAGYWVEGSVAFLLNASVLAFGVYEVWTGYYVTGYLLGAGILSATYMGGFERASFLLEKRNYEKVRAFNNHIKSELINLPYIF